MTFAEWSCHSLYSTARRNVFILHLSNPFYCYTLVSSYVCISSLNIITTPNFDHLVHFLVVDGRSFEGPLASLWCTVHWGSMWSAVSSWLTVLNLPKFTGVRRESFWRETLSTSLKFLPVWSPLLKSSFANIHRLQSPSYFQPSVFWENAFAYFMSKENIWNQYFGKFFFLLILIA